MHEAPVSISELNHAAPFVLNGRNASLVLNGEPESRPHSTELPVEETDVIF
jgi:hypothetical protein